MIISAKIDTELFASDILEDMPISNFLELMARFAELYNSNSTEYNGKIKSFCNQYKSNDILKSDLKAISEFTSTLNRVVRSIK